MDLLYPSWRYFKEKNDRDRELIDIVKKRDIIKIILILYLSVKILFRKILGSCFLISCNSFSKSR